MPGFGHKNMDAAFRALEKMMSEEQISENELDELFNGDEEADEAEAETTTEKPDEVKPSANEAKDAEAEADAQGAETQEEPETPSGKESKLIPITAYHEEKTKRQRLEEENRQLKNQLPSTEEVPDYNEDPEAYDRYRENQWRQKQLQEQEAAWTERLEKSREKSLLEHDDHVKIENIFSAFARQDPELLNEFFNSPDPAKFAYDKGKEILAGLTTGETPTKNPEQKKSPPDSPVVPSLATATASEKNSVQVEKDEDLDEMFDDMKY